MKKLAIIWFIGATIFAAVTTILNIEPAATFIRLFASSDGSFYIIIPVGITFIICILPLFPIMIINNIIQNRKNKMPVDLSGKTGIVVKRAAELPNAALMYEVIVDNVTKSKVGVGKKVFVELNQGSYQVQIKLSKKVHSAIVPVDVIEGKISAFYTKVDLNKSLTSIVPSGNMLLLDEIPFAAV